MADSARRITIESATVARVVLVGVAVWALAHLLWLGRDAIFVAMLAGLVALFLSFWSDLLVDRVGMHRGIAAVLVLLVSIALFAGLAWLLWPTLQDQFSTVRAQLPRALERVSDWARGVFTALGGEGGPPMPDVEQQVQMRLREEAGTIIGGALPLLNTVIGGVFGVFVVLAAGLFMAVDPQVYRNGLVRLVPPRGRARVGAALGELGHTMRWWMVGTGISMLIIAVATTLALWAIRLPGFVALGVIAGLLQFIPTIGPFLSAIPAVALALVIAPSKVVWVILIYVGIQAVESNFLTPLIMKKAVHVPPGLSIVFQALMAIVFGFLGLLLAVPILAATLVLVERLYVENDEAPDGEATA
ncbi:MAG TPA: AI-2E family transporter [Longimicrobiales bacterium]|nr:AI-2E family transporter [Longimicrobiales bacterium]